MVIENLNKQQKYANDIYFRKENNNKKNLKYNKHCKINESIFLFF